MKWIVLGVVLFIVFAIFRRMSQESRLVNTGVMTIWQQRAPMAFEDFYAHFYARSGIPAEDVRKILQMIAQGTGVPEDRLRPEDRLEDLKPGALRMQLGLMKRLLMNEQIRREMKIEAPQDWKVDTVHEVITTLGPYGHHAHTAGE
ncbi:MAG TPA: hypothetical protein VN622_11955 [Clostridia bacterium]|nr:hypothetical protein [Clostridia bacterium]